MPATWYVDFVNGADNNDGTSFAERVKTLAKVDNLSAAGDTIRVMGTVPTNALVGATWTQGNTQVDLQSPLAKTLFSDETWYSASPNIIVLPTPGGGDLREGNACARIIPSGFSTGRAAVQPLGSITDLSEFQQLSFWVMCNSDLAAETLRLDLCSDANADVIVNSFIVDKALAANRWTVVTIDYGQPLSESVQCLRLTALKTINNRTILLDNIVACKRPTEPDCLTLSSLISPDGTTWYPVRSIKDTTVHVDFVDGNAKGYQGDTVTSSLQLLQPTISDIGDGDWAQTFADAGNAAARVTISGGWDISDMASQTGLTVIDRMDNASSGIRLTGNAGYITIDGFAFVRCADATTPDSTANEMVASNCTFAKVGTLPDYLLGMTYYKCNIINCMDSIQIAAEGKKWTIDETKVWGSPSIGIQVTSPGARIRNSDSAGNHHGYDIAATCVEFANNSARKNVQRGFSMTDIGGILASNLRAVGNGTAEVYLAAPANNEINGLDTNTPGGSSVPQVVSLAIEPVVLQNWRPYTGSSPTAVTYTLGSPGAGRTGGRSLVSKRHQGEASKNNIYSEYGLVTTDGADSYNGSGLGWKFQPNSSAFATSPLRLLVSRIPCAANEQTTIRHYAKRSTSGVNARFRIIGGRYAGVGSVGTDIVSTVTATSFTAHDLVFTPSENCVVEVFFEVWGSTTQFATISGPLSLTQNSVNNTYVLAPGAKSEPTSRGALKNTTALTYVTQATPYFVSDPVTSYSYDKLGRLIQTAWINGQSQTVTYDTMGNRTLIAAS